jgi:hypothetical protein
MLAAAIAAGVAWLYMPDYVVLQVPVAKHLGGGDFWWESQYSTLAFADEPGVQYVHRQVGTAYPDAQGWKTEAEVIAYFDAWFAAHGWDVSRQAYGEPFLPETRLVKQEQTRCYSHSDDRGPRRTYACVAVWPIASDTVEGFNVALATSRPSWLQRVSGD